MSNLRRYKRLVEKQKYVIDKLQSMWLYSYWICCLTTIGMQWHKCSNTLKWSQANDSFSWASDQHLAILHLTKISRKSKKHNIVAKSIVEVEYKITTFTTCELIQLKQLHKELYMEETTQMMLIYHNQVALGNASNPIFWEDQAH